MQSGLRHVAVAGVFLGLAVLTNPAQAFAQAFDCTKAATKVEKTICANEALLDADEKMSAVYRALAGTLSKAEAGALKLSQRQWIKRRGWCENLEKPVSKCILRETIDRARILAGEPLSGPGAGQPMVPVFLAQAGDDTQYEVDVTALRFAEPTEGGAKLFNAEIDEYLSHVPMGKSDDIVGAGLPYSHQLQISVSYASPAFISAKIFFYQYTGGAHGSSSTQNINIDLKAGRKLDVDGLFKSGARTILEDSCYAQIAATKKARFGAYASELQGADDQRRTVAEIMGGIINWSFSQAGATVTFDPYVIGSYAEGSYECTFDMDVLQALVVPASPFLASRR